MRSIFLFFASGLTSRAVSALDWSVPTTWRKPTTSISLTDRINLARAASDSINTQYDASTAEFYPVGFWPSANILSSLALEDKYAGTKTYQAQVTSGLTKAASLHPHFDKFGYNDDALWWGTAAFYAFQAYGDLNMLSLAEANWDAIQPFQVTAAQAAAHKHPKKSFTIVDSCNSKTIAGGVFWRPTTDDQSLNAITTDLFMTLSGYLASQTGDAKYKAAAELAAQWVHNHLFNDAAEKYTVADGISPTDCKVNGALWTYNAGKFIEGLSVLVDVTGNTDYASWLEKAVYGATKPAPWTGSDGIITEAQSVPQSENNDGRGFKAILIRSLGVAHGRASTSKNAGLRALIRGYVNVQYNALLDLARVQPNGHEYAALWHGPFEQFYTHAQMVAVSVLVAAIPANK